MSTYIFCIHDILTFKIFFSISRLSNSSASFFTLSNIPPNCQFIEKKNPQINGFAQFKHVRLMLFMVNCS